MPQILAESAAASHHFAIKLPDCGRCAASTIAPRDTLDPEGPLRGLSPRESGGKPHEPCFGNRSRARQRLRCATMETVVWLIFPLQKRFGSEILKAVNWASYAFADQFMPGNKTEMSRRRRHLKNR